jgi:mycobactin lysine-N-oxygenase
MREQRQLAVIGGGPKAVALAAKAQVLRELGLADVELTIFEPQRIGAHWDGRHGYTDGVQALCTPAERDLGFPYNSDYGKAVDGALYAGYSWASYLVTNLQRYGDWVDLKTPPSAHHDFAGYLRWAATKSAVRIVPQWVRGLQLQAGRWQVRAAAAGARPRLHAASFDGVVVTGPGPARRVPTGPLPAALHDRIFDGASFWADLAATRRRLAAAIKANDDSILVIGGGGTGAAILAWLTRNGYHDQPMILLADQATLFSRGDSVFENQLFSDPQAWRELSPANRAHFFSRLTRGVVWNAVMEDLTQARRLVLREGRASRIARRHGQLLVENTNWTGRGIDLQPAVVIDASGFDAWWFTSLLDQHLPTPWTAPQREQLKSSMDDALCLGGQPPFLPAFHAPMLAEAIGPDFGNLMCLGAMTDRILSHYAAPHTVLAPDQIPGA